MASSEMRKEILPLSKDKIHQFFGIDSLEKAVYRKLDTIFYRITVKSDRN